MAITPVNLTGNIGNLVGAITDPMRTKVWIDTNIDGDQIIDADGKEIRLGNVKATVEADGRFTFTGLAATNSATQPTAWQYRVHIDYPVDLPQLTSGGKNKRWSSDWFSLTSSKDLSEVVGEVLTPPNYRSDFTAEMDAIRAEAEAAAAQARDISNIDTPDSLVATLVSDSGSATGSALSASYGRTYRPSAYGAVGDGVADDTAAFEAMCADIAANPLVPALVEITQVHRIPAPTLGINFDAEDVEIYLAAGSHIFSEAASATGGLLSCVGHLGLGTATTPRRRSLYVHGPGKVTGWLGGPNENAIGIVRYEKVLVDGPHVNAGHKGVTAQIGCPYVTIRNIDSDECVHQVVTVEDQADAVVARVENIRFGTAGEHAVLASGADVRVRRVVGDEAWTSGGTTAGAVHITTSDVLDYAEALDIDVADAHSAKGVVISQAQDFLVDRVRIGASTGNAVDLFNCPNGGAVGLTTAPNSPVAVATTGTTVAGKVRRITADPNLLTIGEGTMSRLSVNTTTISLPTGTMRLAYFQATKTETIGKVRVISGASTPTGVTLMRVGVYEVNDVTGALTLVASTANDTTYPSAANTAYTKNLSTSFVKRAGRRYAVGLLGVFTGGALQVPGVSVAGAIASEAGESPRLSAAVGGLSDLPGSQTITTAHGTAAMPYFVLTP